MVNGEMSAYKIERHTHVHICKLCMYIYMHTCDSIYLGYVTRGVYYVFI